MHREQDGDNRFSDRRNHGERTLSPLLIDLLSAAPDFLYTNRVAKNRLAAA
jgi:hypothetical protein